MSKRLAAIDIGTNSIRSMVVEVEQGGAYRVLDDEKATVRLGEGLNTSGIIAAAAMERAIETLARLKKIIDGYGVKAIEAVATSAVRRAANGAEFQARVKKQVGLEVRVISGEEEAELAAGSAFHNFDLEGLRHVTVDIGGGSLELVMAAGSHIEEITSLELGAVILTESFLHHDPVTVAEQAKLRRHVRKVLNRAFPDRSAPVHCLIGSGGTVTAIAAMTMAGRREGYGSLHGYELLRSDVVHLVAMLTRKDLKERRAVPGLNPDRADIIVAGVIVIDELLDFFDANLLRVNERGIREGLILKGLQRHRLVRPARTARSWRESALEFAESCHFDEGHSLHVARLSLEIFRCLAGPFRLNERERRLLEAAAFLHDIGYFINYSSHHKHSYHLIRHADLFGFTPRERELIAQIARYHRKSLPKRKHEEYQRLSPLDRQLVSRLGGILRLADGLDRRRSMVVTGIEARIVPPVFKLLLLNREDASVELYGAKSKGELFEQAFGLQLDVEAQRP